MPSQSHLSRPIGLLLILGCLGCTPEQRHFGRPVESQNVIAIADVNANLDDYRQQPIVVRGRIGEVCQTAGCWCILRDGTDQLYVSLSTFSLPRESQGRDCRAAGTLVVSNDRPTLLANGIEVLAE